MTESDPWADVVIAMLSVNNYPLDKTFSLFDQLRANRLFDPSFLAASDAAELARRLGAAGYDRGTTMTEIFADRLLALGHLAESLRIDACTRILTKGSRDEVSSLLGSVKGVGPKVLENFFVLRGNG